MAFAETYAAWTRKHGGKRSDIDYPDDGRAKRVMLYRVRKGWTSFDMFCETGLGFKALAKLENPNAVEVSHAHMLKVAAALGVPVRQLYFGDLEPCPTPP